MVPLRVLSRINLADTSRRSAPNPRSFNALQPLKVSWLSFSDSRPLFSIACSLFLQFAGGWGIPTRSLDRRRESTKTPDAEDATTGQPGGCTSAHPRHPLLASAVCATWHLYPLWPQSIAHTSRHHEGVYPDAPQIFREHGCVLSQLFARHSPLAVLRCYHKLHET